MNEHCIKGSHLSCEGCSCCCHWDKVLVKYFADLGRKQAEESLMTRPNSYTDTRSAQPRAAKNQVKLRLTDEEFDWIYGHAPKSKGNPNIAAGVRNLIREAKDRLEGMVEDDRREIPPEINPAVVQSQI
jgi:hypothetical protein